LFEILKDRIENARVADLFAGTGALGLEALSRGAKSADFYESHRAAVSCVKANVESLGLRTRARIVTTPLPEGLSRGEPYDLVFMDPPWRDGHELRVARKLMNASRLSADGLLVIESPRDEPLEEALWAEIGLALIDKRNYGDTELRFLAPLRAALDPQ
jgi:16S rRNA (guanine(966)-N(2))-methyltransferase RsmD